MLEEWIEPPTLLSLLENARINDADDDETCNDQSQSHKGNEEDAASAGRKLPSNDPILDISISLPLYRCLLKS